MNCSQTKIALVANISRPSLFGILLAIAVLILLLLTVDWIGFGPFAPRKIPGLPYVRGYPLVGVLYQVNNNPLKQYMSWAGTYGDVFQMRMGCRMVVVANSFESVKDIWIRHSNSSNSRPILYTFHTVVSSTQGFTVGTTPYGESYKRKKKLITTALNKRSVDAHSDLISDECLNLFKRIAIEDRRIYDASWDKDIDLFKLFQGYVLRVSLFLTYGYLVKVDHDDKCKLFDEITHVENMIVKFRGHSSNAEDYVPILRWLKLGNKIDKANEYRKRRDVYMTKFLHGLEDKMKRGEDDGNSIVSRSIRGIQNFPCVNADELRSVCLTMVSAGLDNIPLVLNHIVGHLSDPSDGFYWQGALLTQIVKTYGTLQNAFHQCAFGDTRVGFVIALLEEGLRYFSVLPTSLPRATTKPILYRGVMIPENTILFMNAFAANHDSEEFCAPYFFYPQRYLDSNFNLVESSIRHFAFGAGTRACGGSQLAMKEMYIALVRLIVLYEIHPPRDKEYQMGKNPFTMNSCPDSVAFEPFAFKVHLRKRDPEIFDELIAA